MTIKDMKKSLVVFLAIFGLFSGAKVSAVTYRNETDVQFRFNSEINVTIDSADIEILDLAPGTSSDSNIVGITVGTNSMVGYTAMATVGSSANATTNMSHANGTNVFSSISTDASLANLTDDNTWGYSTSTDNGASWANFSGLPVYTDTAKEIAVTDSPSNDVVKFKINAKASADQPSGDYTNVINFTIIANIPPRTIGEILEDDPAGPRDPETGLPTIQSVTEEVCDMAGVFNETSLLTDVRDHQNYKVAKLKDNRCWFIDNMQLDLMTTSLASLQGNTNASNEALSYLKGVSSRDPATDPEGEYPTKPVQLGVMNYYEVDYDRSMTVPKIWVDGKDDVASNDVIEELRNVKFGIYYNFCAASAGTYCYGSGTWDGAGAQYPAEGQDRPNTAIDSEGDICPTNWRLPTGLSYDATLRPDGGEWQALYDAYDNNVTAARKAALLTRSGYFDFDGGYYNSQRDIGYYWSSTFAGPRYVAPLYVYDNFLYSGSDGYRSFGGYQVRCIVKKAPKFTVNFDYNDGFGKMDSQQVSYGKSLKLQANTFTRSGYVFTGWNTSPDGTGTSYPDKGTLTAPSSEDIVNVTLYAQWALDTQGNWKTLQDAFEMAYVENSDGSGNYYDTNAGRYKKGLYVPHKTGGVYDGTYFEATQESDYEGIPPQDLRFAIQDIDLTINGVKVCDYATFAGTTATVLDLRDYTSYRIVKAEDGRCWMQDNLALDIADSTVQSRITTSNTNLDSASLTALISGNRANGNRYATAGAVDVTNQSISYSYSVPNINKANINTVTYDPDDPDPLAALASSEQWRAGIYYNFCAASAGSFCYGNGSDYTEGHDRPDTAIDAEYDICPSGWRLPTGYNYWNQEDDGDEFQKLLNKYDTYTRLRKILRLPLAGTAGPGSTWNLGDWGSYWTSTYQTSGDQSVLAVSTSGLIFDDWGADWAGLSVRCIAK